MSETRLKDRAGTIYTVVEAVILGISVCLLAWTSSKLVVVGELVSTHSNQIVDISKRIEKLETAALLSATMPGKLETISARLDAIASGQARIERLLETHSESTK